MNRVEFKKILIVEDSDKLRNSLAEHFSKANDVTPCANFNSALEAISEDRYDIILLDLILPDENGLKLMEYVGQTPVVILSDLGADSYILDGLGAGAADYIVKPASIAIIEARMALRLLPDDKANIASRGLILNIAKRTASYEKTPLNLTSSEFNILMFLMQNAGNFYTASEIYEEVWKMPYLNTTTIKAHLSNLRKKMLAVSNRCASLIITEFGKGYAFIDSNE